MVVAVKVTTRAAKAEILGITDDGTLNVKVTAVPERGRANEELRSLLAVYFDVGKSRVELISGESSKHKRLRISM